MYNYNTIKKHNIIGLFQNVYTRNRIMRFFSYLFRTLKKTRIDFPASTIVNQSGRQTVWSMPNGNKGHKLGIPDN